ncbi:MAG: HAMP domain-containing histidine kinase, partial [Gemmataceae bacterium]|nr:HAMP domain-containing histidine kinase [Gemmataceae bacterium]
LYPESLWREARWEAMLPSLFLGGMVGIVAVGLAVLQGRALARRVGELDTRTRRIAGGDLAPMPLPARDDEVRDLAGAINEMAARLAQLHDAIRRTERLRLLGQVSGGLAHELRNGLTGARLAVQLHLHESGAVPGESDPLAVALRQLTLLETQVQRLLGLGRAGAPDRREQDLAALVREACALLLPRCRHAGIALECECAGPMPASVDAGQIGQMAVNLLGNAIDAAGPGGAVSVRLSEQEGKAVLEVADTGPGPAEEMTGRLFEPFATSKPEGIGLGLAVAKDIAEGHGGAIVWQRQGGRTVFRVTLPLA